MSEQYWLTIAVRLAKENVATDNLPFGAVVVLDDKAVATGVNTTRASGDPSEHAEVQAIRAACRELGRSDLAGAIVFTSCEPCVMCQATAVVVGIRRLVYACSSAGAAELGFPDRDLATRLQGAWREAEPGLSVPGPYVNASEPFVAWKATHRSTT